MNTRFTTLGACGCVAFFSGCASLDVDHSPPSAFEAPCSQNPNVTFSFNGTRDPGIGEITNVRATLLINGEERPMQGPSGSAFGIYQYSGSIPHDGEARYRFRVEHRVGSGFFSTNAHGMSPADRYIVRPVGKLTWTATGNEVAFPDSLVTTPDGIRPHRLMQIQDVFQPGELGPKTKVARVTLHNGYSHPVRILLPVVTLRGTGGSVPGISIDNPVGSPIWPVAVAAGGDLMFDVKYSATLTGTSGPFYDAAMNLQYSDQTQTCSFGPIWIDVGFYYNPP